MSFPILIFTEDALQVAGVGQDKALSCPGQQQHTSKRNDPRQGRAHAASRSRDEGDGDFFVQGLPWLSAGLEFGEKQAVRAVPQELSVHLSPQTTRPHNPELSLEKSGA